MAKAAIRYRLLPGTAGKKLADAEIFAPKAMTALIAEIAERARTNIAKKTPVGHSGILRGAYDTEIRRRGKSPIGAVVNPILYHDAVEEGRNAGKPPPTAALVPWVGSKLGIPIGAERQSVAFLVARKIAAKGTEPQKMVEEGWDETRGDIKPLLKAKGLRIVGKLT